MGTGPAVLVAGVIGAVAAGRYGVHSLLGFAAAFILGHMVGSRAGRDAVERQALVRVAARRVEGEP